VLTDVPGIEPETAALLAAHGYRTFNDIINLEHEDLAAIPGIGEETAESLMRIIDELTVEVDEEWDEEEGKFVLADAGSVDAASEEGGAEEGATPEDVDSEKDDERRGEPAGP